MATGSEFNSLSSIAESKFNSSLSLFRRQEMFQNMVHIVIPISLWLGDNSFKQFLICDFTVALIVALVQSCFFSDRARFYEFV